MDLKCCIKNCEKLQNSLFSFHKFPEQNDLKEKWLFNIQLFNKQFEEIPPEAGLCSDHFEKECLYKDVATLRKGSIPTLFPNMPSYQKKKPNVEENEDDDRNKTIKLNNFEDLVKSETSEDIIDLIENETSENTVLCVGTTHESKMEIALDKDKEDNIIQIENFVDEYSDELHLERNSQSQETSQPKKKSLKTKDLKTKKTSLKDCVKNNKKRKTVLFTELEEILKNYIKFDRKYKAKKLNLLKKQNQLKEEEIDLLKKNYNMLENVLHK